MQISCILSVPKIVKIGRHASKLSANTAYTMKGEWNKNRFLSRFDTGHGCDGRFDGENRQFASRCAVKDA